jgi:magnesium transporter
MGIGRDAAAGAGRLFMSNASQYGTGADKDERRERSRDERPGLLKESQPEESLSGGQPDAPAAREEGGPGEPAAGEPAAGGPAPEASRQDGADAAASGGDRNGNPGDDEQTSEACRSAAKEAAFVHPADLADHLENLDLQAQVCALRRMAREDAAEALAELEENVAVDVLENLDADDAA